MRKVIGAARAKSVGKVAVIAVASLQFASPGNAEDGSVHTVSFTANSSNDVGYVCNWGVRPQNDPNALDTIGTVVTYKYRTYDFYGNLGPIQTKVKTSGRRDGNVPNIYAFRDLYEALGHKIEEITIELKTKSYGVDFWFDHCYRGPAVEGDAEFRLQRSVNLKNPSRTMDYIKKENLWVWWRTSCDLQNHGNFKGPATSLPSESTDFSFWSGDGGADWHNVIMSLTPPLTGNGSVRYSEAPIRIHVPSANSGRGAGMPRFCITRYDFAERYPLIANVGRTPRPKPMPNDPNPPMAFSPQTEITYKNFVPDD